MSLTNNDLRLEFRRRVEEHGKCAGVRSMALAHPELSVGLLVNIGNMAGLSPSTVRIQTAQARAGLGRIVTKGPEAAPVVKSIVVAGYDHRAACLDEIERCKKIAREKWGVCPQPRVRWNKRGTVAGTAWGMSEIKLNDEMAAAEGEKFTKRTPGHEYAHCVVNALMEKAGHIRDGVDVRHAIALALGRKYRRNSNPEWAPHGSKWQSVMYSFGLIPSRCHQYESASKLKQQRATTKVCQGKCNCRVHNITARMHAKIAAGARYKCKRCRSIVVAM